jgi:hypothetical protein
LLHLWPVWYVAGVKLDHWAYLFRTSDQYCKVKLRKLFLHIQPPQGFFWQKKGSPLVWNPECSLPVIRRTG